MKNTPSALPSAARIFTVRGTRVVLDSDLAQLYGVPTKRLNQQVRRNLERFPDDFAFVVTAAEWDSLRSQNATLKSGRGRHSKFLPYAFTEHGALMAAGVLKARTTEEVESEVFKVTNCDLREGTIYARACCSEMNRLDKPIQVRAFWDAEAKVWFAESDHVPGLVTEAASVDQLVEKLKTLIPELQVENGIQVSGDIPFKLVSEIEVVSNQRAA